MALAPRRDLQQDFGRARRRQAELGRRQRVLDARSRLIGGDAKAWEAQVRDQKRREVAEKARHEALAAEMRQNDKTMCILEARERRDKKNLCRALNDFQQSFQQPEMRREFDLSDPLALKKDLPARLSDNDVRNTVSGLQKFMGEDLNFHERKRFQEEQNREWSLQQQREWKEARREQKCAEELVAKTRLELDAAAGHLQTLDSATRRAVCAAVKDFNRTQAAEAAQRKMRERRQEQEDDLAEVASLLRGDLLSEDPRQAASALGPPHVARDRWKGVSRGRLEEIGRAQEQQVQEKLRLQEEARRGDRAWDLGRAQAAREALLVQRQQQRQRREQRRALDRSNLGLAREQRLRRVAAREASTSRHTEDYFSQFNTDSR